MAKLCGLILLSFLVVCFLCGCAHTNVSDGVDKTGMIYTEVGEFDALSLSEVWPVAPFDVDENGNILNQSNKIVRYGETNTAAQAAEAIEKEITVFFGEETASYQRPYTVSYDAETELWMVVGTGYRDTNNEPSCGGGWVTALITQENGEILYMSIAE